MKYTSRMKADAEVTIRKRMSDRARKGYDGTWFLEVYEYDTDDGTRYTIINGDWVVRNLTFGEAEALLEEYDFPEPPWEE